MQEIRCPKCGEVFQVDERGYAAIAKQIRDAEFDRDISAMRTQYEERAKNEAERAAGERDLAVERAKSDAARAITEKDREIDRLRSTIREADSKQALAIEHERSEAAKRANELSQEIEQLRSKIRESDSKLELAVANERSEAADRANELNTKISELQANAATQKESYELMMRVKDDEIERLRDMKMKLSTKMIGESLERHCHDEFERLRATAFPRASFEKDNDASDGTKGDFIFRESGDHGEFISIMFEMKHEMDGTATKKRNEDHFAKLNEDRKKKNCEYAVLVSTLEADSDLYNSGIVDVSHRYEKMYVVRPQFFIPIISLLRNAALRTEGLRAELDRVSRQETDIEDFEENLEKFKDRFKKSFDKAGEHFTKAIEDINKTIKQLEKTRDELEKSMGSLKKANSTAEDMTIKKLTRGNKTMKARFAELAQKKANTQKMIEELNFGAEEDYDEE